MVPALPEPSRRTVVQPGGSSTSDGFDSATESFARKASGVEGGVEALAAGGLSAVEVMPFAAELLHLA